MCLDRNELNNLGTIHHIEELKVLIKKYRE